MARYMLHSKKMKLSFQGEVIVCATHIINKTPTCVVTCMTPYEKWCEDKPSISPFWIFGSSAWVHAPNEKRNTLASPHYGIVWFDYSEIFREIPPL
jgi:hypothetical protein